MTGYEIRVIGSLGAAPGQAFVGLAVQVEPVATVVSDDLDQCGLQVLLDRMHAMGLELVAIRRTPRPDGFTAGVVPPSAAYHRPTW